MAWLEQRGTTFRINFRYLGRHVGKTIKTGNRRQAEGDLARLEENLRLLERGRLVLPDGADLATFLLSDGKLTGLPKIATPITLEALFDQYLKLLPAGSMEENSLDTVKLHIKHLKRHLGVRFPVQTLSLTDLQGYVESRSKEAGWHKRRVSPTTIKKELASFSAAWTWASQAGLVSSVFPRRGLKYPKTTEKPPFQTWAEIEAQIARGGLTAEEQHELWGCLFLTLPEIDQLLAHVQQHARFPFIYPMICFAAHTGARRSEVCRSRIADFDFTSRTVLIREKKRSRGKRTTRRVPMTPRLAAVMKEWFAQHPGGVYTICQELHVSGANKTRTEFGPLTRNESNHHFQQTLEGSRWEKVRGWHVFRHSFCSNCAAKGVDQRLIDAWVGHQTEEMVKRYRHLIPSQQQEALALVFR